MMNFVLIRFIWHLLAAVLTRANPISSVSAPSYLTAKDFEQAKLLAPDQYGSNIRDFREHLPKSPKTRANVWKDTRYKWPNARVPYVISPKYNDQERAVIAAAIEEWHSKTCIRFVAKENYDVDYLELTPDDGTSNYCYSYVGRQGGRQFVKMYAPTCMAVGQYIHELGHAIGFGHEHQRPDRDYYVEMKWENIDPRKKVNDSKLTVLNLEAYSKWSVFHEMHIATPSVIRSHSIEADLVHCSLQFIYICSQHHD